VSFAANQFAFIRIHPVTAESVVKISPACFAPAKNLRFHAGAATDGVSLTKKVGVAALPHSILISELSALRKTAAPRAISTPNGFGAMTLNFSSK
jgi:hypothetical protein